jgi:hypothetical protein
LRLALGVKLFGMAKYDLGCGGEWKESFDDGEAAIRRAEELAEGGETVEVARRFLGLHAFVTAFPEARREALKRRRGAPYVGELWGFGVGGGHSGHGAGHDGGGGHGHGGGAGGGHGGH